MRYQASASSTGRETHCSLAGVSSEATFTSREEVFSALHRVGRVQDLVYMRRYPYANISDKERSRLFRIGNVVGEHPLTEIDRIRPPQPPTLCECMAAGWRRCQSHSLLAELAPCFPSRESLHDERFALMSAQGKCGLGRWPLKR